MPSGGNFSSCGCGPDVAACEDPTQPVSTVGLCLSDGTPIAVTVVRDCAGTVTSEGWINLATGAYSTGAPPAGTVACGDSRSIQVSGTFCDIAEDGTVLGLVLVEYSYAADGSVESVRLVDAVTGDTYTPQGEVTTCPAGVEAPERDFLQLCDVAEDGTATPFVRDYQRDETGTITGHTDYALDGAPYTPTGTVSTCQPDAEDSCQNCETLTLCDFVPDEPPGEPEIVYETIPLAELPPAGSYGDGSPVTGALPNGVTYSVNVGEWLDPQGHYTYYPYDGTQTWTFDQPVYLRFGLRGLNISPTECYILPEGAVVESISPAHTWDPDTRRLCGPSGSSAVDESVFLLGPVTELPIVPSGSSTGGRGPGLIEVGLPVEDDNPPAGTLVPFLRTVCRDCDGAVTGVTDTTLDGETQYTPTGDVTACSGGEGGAPSGADIVDCDEGRALLVTLCGPDQSPGDPEPEPCRDVATVLLCDLPSGDDAGGPVTATDSTPTERTSTIIPAPGGAPALWAGGTWVLPEDPDASETDGQQVYRTAAAALQAARPTCDDGTARVTASVRVHLDGPAPGVGSTGRLALYQSGTLLSAVGVPTSPPVGYEGTLTVSATVDAAAVADGETTVELRLETYHGGGKSWTVDQYTATAEYGTTGCETQFMRKVVTDCETGETVSVTDTTLDGQPYEVTGEVGQCQPATECCEPPLPETRVDVETKVLCIQDEAGEITGQVLVEHVYDDQTGERLEQRLTDPTTGAAVELPAGSELVVCQEPPCPVAFATECVGVVERTEASYDNTSLIGGVPGQCGGVQGPGGQFPCQPATGGLTITSWIVDGEEVIGDGGREFAGGPCGQGTDANRGMHRNWASALTNLDPSGATWTAQTEPACLWFVGSTGGTQATYGPMVVEDADGQQWTLSPAQACEETQFTKVYTQDCDGAVSVSWLDADGVATEPPAGDQVPCGTGCSAGGGRGLDVEPVVLCDVAADGTSTAFLRHLTYGSAGQVTSALDTALDGLTPYTPTGAVGVCSESEPCPAQSVVEACRCDDTDGDGVGDTEYAELLGVDCDGVLTSLGTYLTDLSAPYTPVSPVPCDEGGEGADPAIGVQAHRVEVAPGGSWSAPTGVVQSVTATAHSGTGTITTQEGASTLFEGESVTWSVVRSGDAALVGPLVIAADTGTVTVAYTVTVTM